MSRSQNGNIRKALIASILMHATLFGIAVFLPRLKPAQFEKIEIDFQEKDAVQVVKVDPIKDKQQIVEQPDKAINEEVDPNSKFLSKNNQQVRQQTVARNRGEFKNSKSKSSTEGPAQAVAKSLTLDQLKPQLNIEKAVNEKRNQELLFNKSRDEEAIQLADKRQQQLPMARVAGTSQGGDSSQTQDYLKDINEGNETLLATKEFVHYTFYSRIRKQLDQYWQPKVREKLVKIFNEGRKIASTDDRITRLMITLDRQGNLVRVQILGDSGIRDLDEAAIEAFRAAAPFPNPPEGIVESDGTVKIRWDFILEA